MGIEGLITNLRSMLDNDADFRRKKQLDALKNIQSQLKNKQKKLKAKMEKASGKDKDKLEGKLKLVKAHRKKALKAIRGLQKKG